MKAIYKALADFQQEVPVIHKGTKGYGYSYADLPAIFEIINPILKKNKLGFTQLIQGKDIKTILFHTETGETIETVTEIPQDVTLKGMNSFQVSGSAFTYFRRYAISSMLGIITDVDTDCNPNTEVKSTNTAPAPTTQVIKQDWITEEQFEKAKDFNTKQLEMVFKKFKFRDKAQQEELQEIYNNLKSK
jgi:hypothetical protein